VGNLSTPFLNSSLSLSPNSRLAMISGERFDNINYWQDTSNTAEPKFKLMTDSLFKINMRAISGFPSGRTKAVIQKLFNSDQERLVVSNANGKVYIFNHIDKLMMSVKPALIDSIDLMQGQYTLSNGGFGITMADIDGDNKPELLAGNPQGGLVLFKNQIVADGIQTASNPFYQISCYPNPTQQILHVKSNNYRIINSIAIFNMMGKCLLEQNVGKNNTTINLIDLANGVYTLRVNTEEGIFYQKISKQ
jgi:hypothetical protein